MPTITIEISDEQLQEMRNHFCRPVHEGDPEGYSIRIDTWLGITELVAIMQHKELDLGDVKSNIENVL